MTRNEVAKIHGFLDGASSVPAVTALSVLILQLINGVELANAMVFCAAVWSLILLWSAVATDLLCYRIPNYIPVQMIMAAMLMFVGMWNGVDLNVNSGVLWPLIGNLVEGMGDGPFVPGPEVSMRVHIGISYVTMIAIYLLFTYVFHGIIGMGFGDVKLGTACALFFGWPMTGDFLIIMVASGGIWSILTFMARRLLPAGRVLGLSEKFVQKHRNEKNLPYGPAIAVSGTLCWFVMFEGIV